MARSERAMPLASDIVLSSLGYFAVAVVCTLSGYALGHPRLLPSWQEGCALSLLWILLLPMYINRAILYEETSEPRVERPEDSAWLRSMSWQAPLLVLAASAMVWVLASALLKFPQTLCATGGALIAAFPMAIMTGFLTALWPKRDARLYDFRFRSFFPAFATCLPPFVFGFSGCGDLPVVLAASLLVICFWLLATQLTPRRFASVGFIFLAAFQAITVLTTLVDSTVFARWVGLLNFGILLTLAMGVSESWRVTSRILNGKEYRANTPYTADDKQYYLGGTNLATALFLPCFLLSGLHRTTSIFYIKGVLLLMGLQYFCWFLDRTPTKRTWWITIGVLSGLVLPVIVSFGTTYGHTVISAIGPLPIPRTIWELIETGGPMFAALIAFMYSKRLKGIVSATPVLTRFLSTRACVTATGALSCAIGLLLTGGLYIITTILGIHITHSMEARTGFIINLYALVALLCFVGIAIYRWLREDRDLPRNGSKSTAGNSEDSRHGIDLLRNAAARVTVLVRAIRPASTLIAGALCLAIAVRLGVETKWAALATFAVIFATAFGFVVNDIFDLEKDRGAHVRRPIAEGTLSLRSAAWLAITLAAAAIVTASLAGPGAATIRMLLLALLLYSPTARVWPITKDLYTAALSCVPIAYAASTATHGVPTIVYATTALFVVGRELIMDAAELEGDGRAGMRTIAHRIGPVPTENAGWLLMLGALIVLALGSSSSITVTMSILGIASLVAVRSLRPELRPSLSRFPMAFGIIILVLYL